jgi:hypothetical protein
LVYEFFARVLGSGIANVVLFLPFSFSVVGQAPTLEVRLAQPVTEETRALVEHGFVFGIDYYGSVLVNGRRAYSAHVIHRFSYDGQWRVDGNVVAAEEIDDEMGSVSFAFPQIALTDGDDLRLFVKATILPDEEFRQSTGMTTRVLWSHYVPRRTETWSFEAGTWTRR